MKIAVLGATGQVGTDVVAAARSAGCDVLALAHADCDVTDRAALEKRFRELSAGDAAINTAAYHRTDDCEDHPDLAFAVNAVGAYNVGAAARDRRATVAFLSSDYVFDGTKSAPYVEDDVPRPINAYGVSKLAGEMLVRQANPQHFVTRIASVFGVAGSSGKGGNFVETMLAKAARGESIEVVDDIVMSPTYAADAAHLLVALLVKRASPDTYHLANAGACSWYEFANAIFEIAGVEARARATKSATTVGKARRPAYSALASSKLVEPDMRPRPWREALAAYLKAKGHVPHAGRPRR